MRQASAMPHSVGSLPPNATSHAPHDSKARLQNGDETHGFMAKPCTPHLIAQRVQLFKLQTANVGGRGELPSPFSGGFKGGILFGKRIPPLLPVSALCGNGQLKGDTLFQKRVSPFKSPKRNFTLAVCSSKSCTRCAIRCGVHGFAMNPYRLVTTLNRALLP